MPPGEISLTPRTDHPEKGVGFWAPFLCGVKAQHCEGPLVSLILVERGQIRAQESAHFVRNIAAKEREE